MRLDKERKTHVCIEYPNISMTPRRSTRGNQPATSLFARACWTTWAVKNTQLHSLD